MSVLADGDESNSCDNDLLPPYHCLVSRSDSWSRPAGGNPFRVDAGVPGSRPGSSLRGGGLSRESKVSSGQTKRAGHRVKLAFATSSNVQQRSGAARSTAKATPGRPRLAGPGPRSTCRGPPEVRRAAGVHGLGQNIRGPSAWPASASATRRLRNHAKKIIAKSYAGNLHVRIERGMGDGPAMAPRP